MYWCVLYYFSFSACTVVFVLNVSLIYITGIVNPIEAKVRKGKGAVGAYGNERTQQSLQDFPVIDSEEEEEKVHFREAKLFALKSADIDQMLVFFLLYRNSRRS